MDSTGWPFECYTCGALYHDRSLWCLACGRFDTVLPRFHSRQSEAIRAAPFRSALSIYKRHGRWAVLPDPVGQVLGRLPDKGGYLVVISGPPGSGKTSFALTWANAWSLSDRVVYVALEESSDAAIAIHLRRLEVASPNLSIGSTASIAGLQEEAKGAVALFIDSASAACMTGRNLQDLARDLDIPIIANLHVTKDGKPAGPNDLMHVCDVHLRLSGVGKFELRKSRYTGIKEGEFSTVPDVEEVPA